MRRFFSIAAWLIVGTALPLSAQEPKGKKYAVLVGVQEYSHADLPDLRFAQRDVLELSKLLTESGYDVTLLCHETGAKDAARKPTGANIDKHLKEILRKTERADSIIVAFAGHGMQFEKDDDAFFCPMDARPFADEKKTLVSLKNVYKEMERSFAGVKLLLVDACRNDPMLRRGRSGIDADNAPRPPRGVAAMFSCSAGEIAFEHEKLGHGVFFYYVLEGLRGKAKNARDQVTFNSLSDYVNTQVAEEVPKLIGGGAKQSPNLKADLSGAAPVLLAYAKGPLELPKLTDDKGKSGTREAEKSVSLNFAVGRTGARFGQWQVFMQKEQGLYLIHYDTGFAMELVVGCTERNTKGEWLNADGKPFIDDAMARRFVWDNMDDRLRPYYRVEPTTPLERGVYHFACSVESPDLKFKTLYDWRVRVTDTEMQFERKGIVSIEGRISDEGEFRPVVSISRDSGVFTHEGRKKKCE